MNFRKCFIYQFVGHNRTGKTVTALKIAKAYKERTGNRVISFDIQGHFRNLSDEFITDESDFKNLLDRKIKKTLIILDDYHNIINEKISKPLLYLLGQRNEWGLDFVFITHSPALIRQKASYYVTHLFLFYTTGSVNNFKNKLDDPDRVIKRRAQINDIWMNLSEQEQDSLYPNFPYIVIPFAERKDRAVNINKATNLIKNKNER